MRCRGARTAITDRRLGLLSVGREAELRTHLAECESCAAEELHEGVIARDLTLLRQTPPMRVDVRARVMREIEARGPVDRREVSPRQVGWAALAAAGALAAVVIVAVIGFPPLLPEAIRETRWLLGGVGAVASALAQPLFGLLVVLQSLAGVALDLFAKVSHILSRLAVVNQAMMALSLLLMMLVSTYVIARDLRLLPFAVSRKEH
jgi:anti-sigma factor RsiW